MLNRMYSQCASESSDGENSIYNVTSRFSLQSAQMIVTENSSLTQGSSREIVFSPSEDSLTHREYTRFNINITHQLNLNQCLFAFQGAATSSAIWTMVLDFPLTIMIRLSQMNRTESHYALSESMTNLFLKRTNYDANNYHGKYFSG